MKHNKKILSILIVATILKALIIFFFYQNILYVEKSEPKIASSYGWDQLVSSMYRGKYEMNTQSGLSDILDLKSKAYRPPIYAFFLFISTYISNYSPLFLVISQSIITTLIAYLGYKIVKSLTHKKNPAQICLCILFFFPMNFLKAGTIDEGPVVLVFLLAFIYIFIKYLEKQKRIILLSLSSVFLGLSTLTRFSTVFIIVCIIIFLSAGRIISERKINKIFIFILSCFLVLFPWILRNYIIYGEPVLSSGGGRILLFTQSKQFIETFPNKSVDVIERDFLRSFHKSHPYLSELDNFCLDKEFKRLAVNEMLISPKKFILSLAVKLKAFIPYKYYPRQKNLLKDVVYTSSYFLSLVFFILSLLKQKKPLLESKVILIVLIGSVIQGIVFFMLSRHLYVPIVLMIIFSFVAYFDQNRNSENSIRV